MTPVSSSSIPGASPQAARTHNTGDDPSVITLLTTPNGGKLTYDPGTSTYSFTKDAGGVANVSLNSYTALSRTTAFPGTAAATAGKYIGGVVAGAASSDNASLIDTRESFISGTYNRFRIYCSHLGVSGANGSITATAKLSMYEITVANGPSTGFTYTLGTEVAASIITVPSLTPTGQLIPVGASDEFSLDPNKLYAVVGEIVGAALPASAVIRGPSWILGRS